MRKITTVCALGLVLAFAASCGEDEDRNPPPAEEGGAAGTPGSAGQPSGGSAGTPSGGSPPTAGTPGTAGSAGEPAVVAGAGGAPGGAAGAGGAPPPPVTGWEFSVVPGSVGLTGTDVEAQAAPESSVYRTNGMGPTHSAGLNTQRIAPADIGLADTDDVDGISYYSADAYYEVIFSVEDLPALDEGVDGTDVRVESDRPEVPGDVFTTEGAVGRRTRLCIPSPCAPNNNYLMVDESRSGLQPETEAGTPLDNLNALDWDPGMSPIYFTVAVGAAGLAGTAVEGTAADEMGCTVFRSDLDGANEVYASCADLGLVAGDEIDALYVGEDLNPFVMFSVDIGATGAAGTAVEATVAAGLGEGAHIFGSTMDGTNAEQFEPADLGLEDDDNLDAMDLFGGLPAKFSYDSECAIPMADIPVYEYGGFRCTAIGLDTLLCHGVDAANQDDLGFAVIDLAACALVGSYFTIPGSAFPGYWDTVGGSVQGYLEAIVAADPSVAAAAYGGAIPPVRMIMVDWSMSLMVFDFTPAPGFTGPVTPITVTPATPVFELWGVAPMALPDGSLVSFCPVDNTAGYDTQICVTDPGGTPEITPIGIPGPACGGGMDLAIDQRVPGGGIDLIDGPRICQHNTQLELLETPRSWGGPYSGNATDIFLVPGAWGADYNLNLTDTSFDFVLYDWAL